MDIKIPLSNRQQYAAVYAGQFRKYLDGFSTNIHEIINCFKLREQIRHMSHKNVLLSVLENLYRPYINLTPKRTTRP